jgi:hypothetical protein
MKIVPGILVLLLAVQLTGLNCIDEQSLQPAGDVATTTFAQGTSHDLIDTGDVCPCHLSFVSIWSQKVEPNSRAVLADRLCLDSHALGNTSLPFRPPVTL